MPRRLIARLRSTDCRLGFTWYVRALFPTSPACNPLQSFSPAVVSELFLDSLGCKVSTLSHPPGVTRPGDCASIIWIVVFPMPTRMFLDETRGKGAWHRGRNGLAECSNCTHSPGRGTATPCERCLSTRVVANRPTVDSERNTEKRADGPPKARPLRIPYKLRFDDRVEGTAGVEPPTIPSPYCCIAT
jgi:hypothetical protein